MALIIFSAILGRTQGSPLQKSPGCAVGVILVIAPFGQDFDQCLRYGPENQRNAKSNN
jgi:hypothetical protein